MSWLSKHAGSISVSKRISQLMCEERVVIEFDIPSTSFASIFNEEVLLT